jgi:hypothetical protein
LKYSDGVIFFWLSFYLNNQLILHDQHIHYLQSQFQELFTSMVAAKFCLYLNPELNHVIRLVPCNNNTCHTIGIL